MPELDSIVEEARRKVEADASARTFHDREVQQAVAFYFGNHWAKIGPAGALISTRPAPGEIRETINLIRPVVDRKVAKLTAARPIYSVTPSTGEPEDVKHALVSEGVLTNAYAEAELDRKIVDATWWSCVSPRVWLKFFWDPFGGRRAARPAMNVDLSTGEPTGEPLLDQTGQPVMEYAYEGVAACEIRTHWEMVWPANVSHESKAKWCIEQSVALCDEIEERYNVRPPAEQIGASDRFFTRATVEQMRGLGASAEADYAQSSGDEFCKVKIYWYLPCKKYPKGLVAIIAGEMLVKRMDFPYEHGMLPFVGISERHAGGSLFGNFVVRDLVAPQININIRRSQITENADLAAAPMFMVPMGSGMNWGALDGSVAQIVNYTQTQGKDPYWANPGQLSPDAYQDLEQAIKLFYKCAETEVLTQDVSADASAIAIQRRIEEDESVLGNSRASMSSALRRGAKMWLSNIKQFMPAERVMRVVGKDKRSAVYHFSADEVRPDFDVDVSLESGSKLSKTVKNATLMQLLQFAGKDNPVIAEKIVPLFEVGGLEAAFTEIQADQAFVERQIGRIKATGEPEPPLPYEVVSRTTEILRVFLTSAEYETWPEPARSALLQTWQAKSQRLQMEKQQEAMQMMAQAQVGADVKGTIAAGSGASMKGPLTDPPDKRLM